jgi:hypothetical protein
MLEMVQPGMESDPSTDVRWPAATSESGQSLWVVKPRCSFLDEPLNLDAQLRVEMRREIRRIVERKRMTGIDPRSGRMPAMADRWQCFTV